MWAHANYTSTHAVCTCILHLPAHAPTHAHARTHTHSLSLTHTHKQNKLEHVLTAIDLSTAIVRRIWLNYLFAMGYNLTAVPLAAGDYYTVYSYVHVHDIVTYPPPFHSSRHSHKGYKALGIYQACHRIAG